MISFRPIELGDNPAIAELIRKVFREFKIDRPGTVYTDPTTDHLYELFRAPASFYWLAESHPERSSVSGSHPERSLVSGSHPERSLVSGSHPERSRRVFETKIPLVGGCGIYPTPGLPAGCAELVKLYVAAEYRGQGIGLKLMEKCFESAKEMGYKQLYLETLPELSKAVGMYEKAGFGYLTSRMGNSGHFNCNIWMLKEV